MTENATKKKKSLLFIAFIGILTVVFLRAYVFTNYEVEGESMMPTLQDGNFLLVNKLEARIGGLERFDIIVFKGQSDNYVKRIIGVPGDVLEYRDDTLYINGVQMDEPFLKPYKQRLIGGNLTGDFTLVEITGQQTVPNNALFVLGDNRLGSWDSRHFGLVDLDQVVGKVSVRYWPAGQWVVDFY
ncbi:signal peptidase I [Litchfieldia alkalitelluris]|uniref:signal peptidase I n=1 Tax=Litchfieldia alkalitelluris TaxID=304268 RepID=UPI0009961FD1|nr:signal peptidase I [Litchfieldia alkalitelluris]